MRRRLRARSLVSSRASSRCSATAFIKLEPARPRTPAPKPQPPNRKRPGSPHSKQKTPPAPRVANQSRRGRTPKYRSPVERLVFPRASRRDSPTAFPEMESTLPKPPRTSPPPPNRQIPSNPRLQPARFTPQQAEDSHSHRVAIQLRCGCTPKYCARSERLALPRASGRDTPTAFPEMGPICPNLPPTPRPRTPRLETRASKPAPRTPSLRLQPARF